MNILFHAGHHKTATTTFQHVLTRHQSALLDLNIHVPVIDGFANMSASVVYKAQNGDWSPYERVLDQGLSSLPPNGTLLFSAEDLENCLVDLEFGRKFISIARSKGYSNARWAFVQRNEFEYFESLYGELAKHKVLMRYDHMAEVILKDGFLCCASPKFRWIFVFDYIRAIRSFRESVCGDVSVFTFQDFIGQPVGRPILDLIGRGAEYAQRVGGEAPGLANVRLSPEDIELAYTAGFLKMSPADVTDPAHREQVAFIAARRSALVSEHRPRIRDAFGRRFNTVAATAPAV